MTTTEPTTTTEDRAVQRSVQNQLLMAWCGPAGIVLVLFGWFVLAGFMPPPSAELDAEATQAVWQRNTSLTIVGLLLCVWGGTLYVLFTGAVFTVVRRIEGGRAVLSLGQVLMGAFSIAFFCWNFMWLACVAFVSDTTPEIVEAMSDVGFIMTFAPIAPFTLQYVLVGLIVLQDRSQDPLVPRWVGFTNLWVGLLLVPAQLIPLAPSGPLAWDGILSFWVAVLVFAVWFFVMFWALRRAILRPRPAAA